MGEAEEGHYLFFTTRQGTVKRTSVTAFANIRSNGLIAIGLKEDDELVNVLLTDGQSNIIIGTHNGYSVTFKEEAVRDMGRTRSISDHRKRLRKTDKSIGISSERPRR